MKDNSPAPLDSSSAPDRSEAIFHGALQLPPEQRADYIKLTCGNDASLRERIEHLLKANDDAGSFLEEPATPPQNKTIALEIPLTEKAGDRIGRYKLLQQIGEGGCGVVYMAEQEQPVRRRVALKVIKLGMDTKQVVARFEAERQALALMDHPNIAKVLDAGATETGRPFFVMELVRGIKITEYCDQNKLSAEERLKLFIQVCHAIQHAHQKGIIHRDIKPSNILVTVNDGVPVPKVIDFGIAKATEQRLTDKTVFTAFEQFIGTPAYMSPEQAVMTSLDIDTRSDIYSLGVLLYELLTGQTPFDAKKLIASGLDGIRQTIREQEPDRPSTRLRTMLDAELTATAGRYRTEPPKLIHLLRGDLDWIVMKALEKDRTRRYETANGFAVDIQRYLNNEPVTARPPSTLYRFQKLARRNKAAFTAMGTGFVALVFGLALSLYLFVQERAAHQRAVAAEKEQSRLREQAEDRASWSDKIMRAGLCLTRREYDKAEQIISDVPPHASMAAFYNVFGGVHAYQAQWPEALTNFLRVVEFVPNDYPAVHSVAPLLAQIGDAEQYRRHCELILDQFAQPPDWTVAASLAKDCVLLPVAKPTLEKVARFADKVAATYTGTNSSADIPFAKGLAEYRLGNYSNAVDWLNKAVAHDSTRYHNMESLIALAMTQQKLRQFDQAAQNWKEALSYVQRKLPETGTEEFGDHWHETLDVYIILREAKTFMPETAQPAQTTGRAP